MNRVRRTIAATAVITFTLTSAATSIADAHPAPPASAPSTYTVKPGDNFVRIATKLGVRLSALLVANGLTVESVIHPGQVLNVPVASPIPASVAVQPNASTTYTVKAGDFLAGIASRAGVSLRALLTANGLTVTSVIQAGQLLQIPAATNSGPASTTTPAIAPQGSSEADARRTSLVSYLQAQVGKPYKFFTAGPDTFDCSGLVVAGYRQIGLTLPHQSAAQAKLGTAVDWRSEPLRAGDLIFIVSSADPSQIGHVGIALDSTTWIQAVGTGIPVRIRPIPADDRIAEVRRIF